MLGAGRETSHLPITPMVRTNRVAELVSAASNAQTVAGLDRGGWALPVRPRAPT